MITSKHNLKSRHSGIYVNDFPHCSPHSPCWSRHLQTSWTWGWTAGRLSALCAFHLIMPLSYRSLHSKHGSYRPQSLKYMDKHHQTFTKTMSGVCRCHPLVFLAPSAPPPSLSAVHCSHTPWSRDVVIRTLLVQQSKQLKFWLHIIPFMTTCGQFVSY